MDENHHDNEKMVTVAEYEHEFEAEIARLALENEGIEAVVVGGDLVANMPNIEPIHIELKVFATDYDKAMDILEQQAQNTEDDLDEDFDDVGEQEPEN